MNVGRWGSISGLVHTVPTNLSNLSLLSMYHKDICTLHRRFLAKDRDNGRFQISQDRCILSALALLAFQEGWEPFLYKVPQIRQMLTLATMVLFLELSRVEAKVSGNRRLSRQQGSLARRGAVLKVDHSHPYQQVHSSNK